MGLLDAHEVSKRFGGVAAVDGVTFSVEQGEILGLIGPNGAGKTTLLNLVSGVLPLSSGQIIFAGRRLDTLKKHQIGRLGIARTFQIVKPFKGLSVRANVAVGGVYGSLLPLGEALDRADAILEQVGLADKAHDMADTLNLSQRKRLELARALAIGPKILLLDEVMAGLNPRELLSMLDLIGRLNQQGITIVFVEHVIHAIMSVCHRVLVLHHGQKLAIGTPQQIAEDERVIGAYLGSRFAERHRSETAG